MPEIKVGPADTGRRPGSQFRRRPAFSILTEYFCGDTIKATEYAMSSGQGEIPDRR